MGEELGEEEEEKKKSMRTRRSTPNPGLLHVIQVGNERSKKMSRMMQLSNQREKTGT